MLGLYEKTVSSDRGVTYYWTNAVKSTVSLVFLPGLTADHRLFESQLLFFKEKFAAFAPSATPVNLSFVDVPLL